MECRGAGGMACPSRVSILAGRIAIASEVSPASTSLSPNCDDGGFVDISVALWLKDSTVESRLTHIYRCVVILGPLLCPTRVSFNIAGILTNPVPAGGAPSKGFYTILGTAMRKSGTSALFALDMRSLGSKPCLVVARTLYIARIAE